MSGKNVNFGGKKVKKSNFYTSKKVIRMDEIDANKMLVFKEEPYGSKILSNTSLDTMMMMLPYNYA